MSKLYLSNEVKVSIQKSCINRTIKQKDINLVLSMSYSSCTARNPIIKYHCLETNLHNTKEITLVMNFFQNYLDTKGRAIWIVDEGICNISGFWMKASDKPKMLRFYEWFKKQISKRR